MLLLLLGLLITCHRVDIDTLRFKHNVVKSYKFWWDLKDLKYIEQSHKIHHIHHV